MCAILRWCNISKGIVNAIEALYESSKSAVLLGDKIIDWFCTHVGVRKRLFAFTHHFQYLSGIYHDRGTTWIQGISQHWWRKCHQPPGRLTDDIDLVAGQAAELILLTPILEERAKQLAMQISAEKSNL